MSSRATVWRHKTGKSKTRQPKGKPAYETVARLGVKKRFTVLWWNHQNDCVQEIHLLILQVERINRWAAKNPKQGVVGYRRFIRMVWRHFNQFAHTLGYYRPNGTGAYQKREENYESITIC